LICLSVASCAPTPAVKTQTVTVYQPTYVAIPDGLLCPNATPNPCQMPAFPETLNNGTLASYVLALQTALKIDINKLEKIQALQPKP